MSVGGARRKVDPTLRLKLLVEKLERYGTRREKAWPTERTIIGRLDGSGDHRGAREGRFESGK
jgi:hypothetical protein